MEKGEAIKAKGEPSDILSIILTSVGVEITAFKLNTNKITDEDDDQLTDKIVKRLERKLLECDIDDFIDWKHRAIMNNTKK